MAGSAKYPDAVSGEASDLSSTVAGKGASLVGREGGGNVESSLDTLDAGTITLGSGQFRTITLADAATNSAPTSTKKIHTTSGTAAAGFGITELIQLEAGSGTTRDAMSFATTWTTATDATPTSKHVVQLNKAGTLVDVLTLAPDLVILSTNSLERIRLDATGIGFFAATPVAQQVSGANVTNNVTVGGTTDTVDNVVAAAIDTSAADLVTTRNACYQISRKVKQVNDALRTYGLLT